MKKIKIKDHSVSKEQFELIENSEFGMLVTSPQPPISKLAAYYETEEYISHTDANRNLFEKVYHLRLYRYPNNFFIHQYPLIYHTMMMHGIIKHESHMI